MRDLSSLEVANVTGARLGDCALVGGLLAIVVAGIGGSGSLDAVIPGAAIGMFLGAVSYCI